MTFNLPSLLASVPDRWRCWWRPACECDVLRDACVQAVEVIDLYRARNAVLIDERDRAVSDLADVLGLRARNDVMSMLERKDDPNG